MHFKRKNLLSLFLCICFIMMPFNTFAQDTSTSSNNFKVGETYFGFKLLQQKQINDIKSTAMIFKHTKSGADLIFLQNDDDNKYFTINFRTPPVDNCGIPHIIEHSVLGGSKKFPTKNTVFDMIKKSMATFLDAETTSVSTMYPVGSRNDKDFHNLMDVYLDAVFNPSMVDDSKIFDREGWRYELKSKDSNINYNGVVFNEMNGDYSSPQWILTHEIDKSLFPDTPYQYESGGIPEMIPQLSRDKLVDYYKKYYKPSNSLIYLYGNMDIMNTLKFIDGEYLSKFDNEPVDSTIPVQKPFDKRNIDVSEYPVPENSSTANKTYFSLNYVFGNVGDKETALGSSVLANLLAGNASAPISKAVRDAGIGSDISCKLDINKLQPTLSIVVSDSDESKKDEFQKVVTDALTNLVKDGFDQKTIDSTLNAYEMSMRSLNTTANRGLTYDNLIMMGWLYGNDFTQYLDMESDFSNMHKNMNSDYFKQLIQKYMLNNNHTSLVELKPVPGLQSQIEANTSKKLADYKAGLSQSQIDSMIKSTQDFESWESAPDSDSDLAKLPSLSVSDLDKTEKQIPTNQKDIDGIKLLEHPAYSDKINYVNMYFDTSKVPQEKLPYLYLMSYLLGKIGTQNKDVQTLSNDILQTFGGGISFEPESISKYKGNGEFYPKLHVSAYTQGNNLSKGLDLISEIINNSKFDDYDYGYLQELIKQIKSQTANSINSNGVNIAIDRAGSYFSPQLAYDSVGDLDFYNFICNLDDNFASRKDIIAQNLKEVSKLVFNKQNLIVSITGDNDNYPDFEKGLQDFSKTLGNRQSKSSPYKFDLTAKNEGLEVPGKVQYVVKGYNLDKPDSPLDGSALVLENILNTGYLYPEIRFKGGAYGAGSIISPYSNNVLLYSYRDPNLTETLSTYDNAANFIKNLKLTDSQMSDYIISTVAGLDYPENVSSQGIGVDSDYMSGITQDDIQKVRDEVLKTTPQDIQNYAPMIDSIMKQNNYCVLGDSTKIEQNKNVFKNVINVLDNTNKSLKIILNKKSTNISIGSNETLLAVNTQDNSSKNMKWSSSNENVAKVDQNGCVTGISSGEAVITVSNADGSIKESCTVNVNSSSNPYDVNSDGKVDIYDLALLQAAADAKWSGNSILVSKADINKDGKVDKSDIDMFNKNNPLKVNVLDAKSYTSSAKELKIKFNSTLNANTINKDNIAVMDSNGNIVPTDTYLDSDGMTVTLNPPMNGYMTNSSYYLIINSNLQTSSGSNLKEPTIMKFNINNTAK